MKCQGSLHCVLPTIGGKGLVCLIFALIASLLPANIYSQTQNRLVFEDVKVYVKEAVITDSDLVNVLKQSIIPIAKANNYNPYHDYIEISSKREYDSIAQTNYETIIINITPGDYWREALIRASISQELSKLPIYQTQIDGIKFYLMGKDATWFKGSNRIKYLGTYNEIEVWHIGDDVIDITLWLRKSEGHLQVYEIGDMRNEWIQDEAVKQYLPKLPGVTLKDEERKLPVIDTELKIKTPKGLSHF